MSDDSSIDYKLLLAMCLILPLTSTIMDLQQINQSFEKHHFTSSHVSLSMKHKVVLLNKSKVNHIKNEMHLRDKTTSMLPLDHYLDSHVK